MSGYFICFEGLDGSGKSTQIDVLADRIELLGYSVVKTRCPGGSLVSEKIRELVLGEVPMTGAAELLLHVAARAELYATVIEPALRDGKVVICSRFMDSCVAYQGRGRGMDVDLIYGLDCLVTRGVAPDLTVYLDITVAKSLARIRERGGGSDRMERESVKFYERVRREFLRLAGQRPYRYAKVNALLPVDEVSCQVWDAVNRILSLE